jgi:hypothetical protein
MTAFFNQIWVLRIFSIVVLPKLGTAAPRCRRSEHHLMHRFVSGETAAMRGCNKFVKGSRSGRTLLDTNSPGSPTIKHSCGELCRASTRRRKPRQVDLLYRPGWKYAVTGPRSTKRAGAAAARRSSLVRRLRSAEKFTQPNIDFVRRAFPRRSWRGLPGKRKPQYRNETN